MYNVYGSQNKFVDSVTRAFIRRMRSLGQNGPLRRDAVFAVARISMQFNGRKCGYCSSTEQWKKINTLIPMVLVYKRAKPMHCIMFGLNIFTMQLLGVGYDIFCEFNVAHKN